MVINNSMVNFSSSTEKATSYETQKEILMRNVFTGEVNYQSNSYSASYKQAMNEYKQEINSEGSSGPSYKKAETGRAYTPGSLFTPLRSVREQSSVEDFVDQLRRYLYNFRQSILDFLGVGRSYMRGNNGTLTLNLSSGNTGNVWTRTVYESTTYTESESMEFSTKGTVVTADGRSIDFNMSVEMSREFVQSAESMSNDIVEIYTDPLVITLNSDPVSVSDQKWSFDIDGDGNKDSISLLSKGNGFLAFDKDRNGKIDDGSELFGSKTGNGFSELAVYDDDGNGWIDEADEIYDKLSVWLKDDSGQDKLISLRDANVGAIYLGSATTDYALKSEVDNACNAQLRRSGLYLTNEGISRSISQLDFVKASAAT
jgi:hypothetical protein